MQNKVATEHRSLEIKGLKQTKNKQTMKNIKTQSNILQLIIKLLFFIFLFFTFSNNINYIYIFINLSIFYFFLILYLTYFIYSVLTKKNKNTYFRYISILKDKDFILFKDSLFKFYSSITIILFIYLFKLNSFYLLLDLDNYFLFFSLILLLLLISNWFILFLFNIYTEIKICINLLNDIKFDDLILNKNRKIFYSRFTLTTQARSFSTSSKKNIINPDAENTRKEALSKPLEAGCFNYTKISNLGNINEFYSSEDNLKTYVEGLERLEDRLKDFIRDLEIPENKDLFILPVIRKTSRDESNVTYRSFHLTLPIKRLYNSLMDYDKLARILLSETLDKWSRLVNVEEGDLELYLMGRPWLDFDEYDPKDYFDGIKHANALNILLENKISEWSNIKSSSIRKNKKSFPNNNNRKFSTSTKLNSSFFEEDNKNDFESTKNYLEYHKAKSIKEFKKAYGGGYLGYTKIHNFGNISQFYQSSQGLFYLIDKLKHNLKDYVNEIPENIIFSTLPVLRWQYSTGEYRSISVSDSLKITRNISLDLLAKRILFGIKKALSDYNIKNGNLDLYLMGRPWLDVDEFNSDKFIDRLKLDYEFDKVLEKKISAFSDSSIDFTDKVSNKVLGRKDYEYKNILMDNYGDPVLDQNQNLIGYQIDENNFVTIETFYNENNSLCNKVSLRDLSEKNLNLSLLPEALIYWIDTKTESGFVREFNKMKYVYDVNNKLINVESTYTCSQFPISKKDVRLNNKIGVIDFETYGSDSGMGHHSVYAGGWAIKDNINLFYINKNETNEQLVNRIFSNIFMSDDLNGYTFYAHNLGRFDSIFILKSLISNKDISMSPVWKDNCILSLKIKFNDIQIKILDSLQLIPGSLDSILKSFNCNTQKGYFPYSFVNENNLYYIGDKPNKEFYNNISDLDYNSILTSKWDLKNKTLDYLKSDLKGLLEVLTKFNNNIFTKYQLNITKFPTISSLTLAAYRSSYIPENLMSEFKMVKGEVESELRTSYFGGNVDVFINKISNGYLYDINSQYPKAMLEDMPIGDPVLSLENNLDKIFGFVFAEISCPDASILQVPFIQYNDPFGQMNICPRGKFKRLIFSEEAKYALKYGYKIKIEYCYQFKRGKDLFKNYILDHYNIKSSTKDPVQRAIAKLFLNALYGRMGMKDIENTMKIVDKRQAEILDKNTNVSVVSKLTDNKFLVKYSGQINDNIRKLYKTDPLISHDIGRTIEYSKDQLRKSGLNKKINVPSAVHIASAISSYARMIINEYKNIPGNPCIMSDTDSAVLTKPLPSPLIGGKLGQMKLEQEIVEGLFIRKKLYYLKNTENQEIIKASGVDSSHLNYNLFIRLLKGESITIKRTNFNVEWKELKINIVSSEILIQGLSEKIKTIYNTLDVNFKYISFPINYNIIIKPFYFKPYNIIVFSAKKQNLITLYNNLNKKSITVYKPKTYSIILHPLYQLSEYICWLIGIFFNFYFFYTEECGIK